MSNAQLWYSRPIFITSTFRDMGAERDYLRNVVFPELEERLKDRRHTLEPIDLRWGVETVSVSEEQAKELLVLKVCLAEIERSRPFLLALVGDRYGWIPPQDRLAAAAQEAGLDVDVRDKSITALEIEYGILSHADQQQRSYFYFRKPLPYDEMTREKAADYCDLKNPGGEEEHGRVVAFKERIRQNPQFINRVRDYQAQWDSQNQKVTGLEAWGRMVLEDLWRDLDEETKAFLRAPETGWQEQERWTLEEFVQNRNRGFIGRMEISEEIMGQATSPAMSGSPCGLCLVGDAGSGKSALFSHIYGLLQDRNVLLLASAAGISPRSGEVNAILLRWIEDLAQFLEEASPLPEKPTADDIEEQFVRLLGRAAIKKRIVIMIDALNQLESTPRAHQLTWLPKPLPDNVRMIATTLPGEEADAMKDRGGVILTNLPALQRVEARDLIDHICDRYHRKIHPQVAEALLSKKNIEGLPAFGNPLWLELAVEEINLLDTDDFSRADKQYTGSAEERLHHLLLDTASSLPCDIEGLYEWMLGRNEKIHGTAWSKSFAVVMALSRNGWRESDLRMLMPMLGSEQWDDLHFAVLRRSFRGHLVRRGVIGQYDFFHQQMRCAVEKRYCSNTEEMKKWHHQIADFLQTLPAEDKLRQDERMHHLISADDSVGAARYYSGELASGELAGATRALAGYIRAARSKELLTGLPWVLQWLDGRTLTANQIGQICHRFLTCLYDDLYASSTIKIRITLMQQVIRTLEELVKDNFSDRPWERDLAAGHDRMGDIFMSQGDSKKAFGEYQKSLQGWTALTKVNPADRMLRHGLSWSMIKCGDVYVAEGHLDEATKIYRDSRKIFEDLIGHDPSNSLWQKNLSSCIERIAKVMEEKWEPYSALLSYRESLAIKEKLAAADPEDNLLQQDLAGTLAHIGEMCRIRNEMSSAEKAYQDSITIRVKMVARDPSNILWQRDLSESHSNMGQILNTQGKQQSALQAYLSAINILQKLLAADPSNNTWVDRLTQCFKNVADILSELKMWDPARQVLAGSVELRELKAKEDPTNLSKQSKLAKSHEEFGALFVRMGDWASALKSYQSAIVIREKLVVDDSSDENFWSDLARLYYSIVNPASIQSDDGPVYAKKCLSVLKKMRERGQNLDLGLVNMLNMLENQFGADQKG